MIIYFYEKPKDVDPHKEIIIHKMRVAEIVELTKEHVDVSCCKVPDQLYFITTNGDKYRIDIPEKDVDKRLDIMMNIQDSLFENGKLDLTDYCVFRIE